jgi:D-alanine-D-alanine ligase
LKLTIVITTIITSNRRLIVSCVIVKPASSGSSVGISFVKDFLNFESAIREAFKHSNSVIVEEYITGKEATCGVIDSYRNYDYYPLPPVEIIPHEGTFFDYASKYEGKSNEIVPGNFTDQEKKEIERLAVEAHKGLGLRHYSRSDFIIHPHRGVFILETNTLPGLTEESLILKALESVGATLEHFLDHVVQLALSRK